MVWIRLALLAGVFGAGCLAPERLLAQQLTICHGYSCHFKTPLALGSGDMKRIEAIMRAGQASAASERRAVSILVQFYERRATAAIGIKDRAKSDFGAGRERGQMDCVDESTNTTSILKFVGARGLLKHHKVLRTASRGFFADGRYPHFTAVLRDHAGNGWAVDSWFEPAGGPPDIMPLEKWKSRGVRGRR